jgi:beta-N-acetylhexosaminidase
MNTSFDSRLGQLFILELQSARWNRRVEELLRTFQPAGAVVRLENVRPLGFLTDLAEQAYRVLRAAPLMGVTKGYVGLLELVLPGPAGHPHPRKRGGNFKQAAMALGKMRGIIQRGTGRNVDFSLALDLAPPAWKSADVSRASGHDPQLVAECAAAYLRGLRQKRVIACGKHFPGMGSVEVNPRTKAMVSAKPMAALWREDLVPFREVLPKLPLVMISHAAYKAYDFDLPRPAVWSSEVVTGLLRVKLGYKGVAVADLAEFGRAVANIDVREATVKALEAGCDLVIVPGSESSVESTGQAVSAALDSGRLSAERMEESLRRIRAMKRKLAEPSRVISERDRRREAGEIRECARQLRKNE